MDIIFIEFERYNKIISNFEGIEWETFSKYKDKAINHNDIELLDEIEEAKKEETSAENKIFGLYS